MCNYPDLKTETLRRPVLGSMFRTRVDALSLTPRDAAENQCQVEAGGRALQICALNTKHVTLLCYVT